MNQPPHQIGPYEITREIGRGGMGVVYLAHDTALTAEEQSPTRLREAQNWVERLARLTRVLTLVIKLCPTLEYTMIQKPARSFILLGVTLALAACSHPGSGRTGSDDRAATPASPYMDQTPPGVAPELFAPGIVNTEAIELNGVFAPDGHEFFFTRIVDDVFTMYRSVLESDGWSDPQPVQPYAGGERETAVDMAYSIDGNTLYFLGKESTDPVTGKRSGLNIWSSERHGEGWRTAHVVPPPVSTEHSESYPCVVSDGSLYFSSRRPGGHGSSDIYRAQRLDDGSFADPVNVGSPINTDSSEGDTFVAPDESYLIVTSSRPGGFGQGDLYISFRDEDGHWSQPVNLGESINSEQVDFCPMVTPDGAYLFFSRRWGATWDDTTRCEVFWVSTKILDQFRP